MSEQRRKLRFDFLWRGWPESAWMELSRVTRGDPVGVFRSRDGEEVWGRDRDGRLVRLAAADRDAWVPDERHRALAEATDRFGLWDHLSPELRVTAVAEIASGCHPLSSELLFGHVEFSADGEELAEGGAERFLRELAPAVQRYGVSLDVETKEFSAADVGDYVVLISGIRCVVWRSRDWHDGDPWTLATIRPLTVVNRLLAAAGQSAVRAHTLYTGGNEGRVFLIDPRVTEALEKSGLLPDHEIPTLAAESVDPHEGAGSGPPGAAPGRT